MCGCSLDEILKSVATTEVSETTTTIGYQLQVTEVVTDWSTFIFQGGWMGQGKGVVASFRLELVN
jgi:hypothetical protein